MKCNIGLEIHCQILTNTKLFSSISYTGSTLENTNIDEISLGYPGSLPVINKKVIENSVKIALAMNCKINEMSMFHRKHYFYHDLPKGYQITQLNPPLAENGYLKLPNDKVIKIERIHIEEDAGKTLNKDDVLLVDFNRAGVALVEIVTDPDIQNAEDAAFLLKEVRNLAVILNLNNGNLQNGEIRCDANVSLQNEDGTLGKKVEIKNLNSFKYVKDAINFELLRQSDLLNSGMNIKPQTRGYNEKSKKTYLLREKESSVDYRFMPEPDLPHLETDKKYVKDVSDNLPELPANIRRRLSENKLLSDDIEILIENKMYLDYYNSYSSYVIEDLELFNKLFMNELRLNFLEKGHYPKTNIVHDVFSYIYKGVIPKSKFSFLINESVNSGNSVSDIIEEFNLKIITDENVIIDLIDIAFKNHPKKLEQIISGNDKLRGFFVGEVMELSDYRVKPDILPELLHKKIKELLNRKVHKFF